VTRFQARQRLVVDGVVGKATHRALVVRAKEALKRTRDRTRASGTQPTPPAQTSLPAAKTVPLPDHAPAVGLLIGLAAAALSALALGVARRRRSGRLVGYLRDSGERGGPQRSGPEDWRIVQTTQKWRSDLSGKPVLGYASVSALESGENGEGFRAQAESIVSECKRLGLPLLQIVRELEPDHDKGRNRPGLSYALRRISAGEAQGLVVAELSRLSRSAAELGEVLDRLSRSEARLVAVEQRLDTVDADGELAARVLIEVSDWERRRLAERTRKGLQAARQKGPPSVADYPELQGRILRMREDGMTLHAIADRLNEDGVPTLRGGAKWRPSSVQAATGYHRPRSGRMPEISARWRRSDGSE
jgi:DNA invertase Pin-like site-specific DNA recombinase